MPQLSILRWGHRAKARPVSPASGLGSLVWATAPAHLVFETLYASPTALIRAASSAASCGRISITTSCCSAVAKCISRSTEQPSSLYPFSAEIHAQYARRLGLCQFARRQNRVKRGRQR
jgi:hypothetical protein